MMTDTVTVLSHWQFALSGLLHFLFIPLTLGLSLLLAVIESFQFESGRRDDYQNPFGRLERLFKLAFVMALASRLPILLQFGANGSYFSHYVGDAFALPLTLEVLSGLILAVLLFGPYSLGRNRLGKGWHLALTWLLVLAMHVSAFWILLSHSWMQYPVAVVFNDLSYRLELTDFQIFIANPVVMGKWLHTLVSSYACAAAAVIVLALRNPVGWHDARSTALMAAITGLIATGLTAIGDPTPKQASLTQSIKQTLIEGDNPERWLPELQTHVRQGVEAFRLLERLRDDHQDSAIRADFARLQTNLGYAWLVKPFNQQIAGANDQQIELAAQSALPAWPLVILWSYRLMIAAGLLTLVLFAWTAWLARQANAPSEATRTRLTCLAAAPWLASVSGWLVAEFGKQPWAIAGLLPSASGVSASTPTEAGISFAAYLLANIVFLAIGWHLAKALVSNPTINTTEAG
ncbi:MAG: cytochrome ubiquinol oxidase subunit I [Methylomonas sp.]|nr:cytochrome ubiquinol oxidase subunit I [Methylomonas sp.]PPD22838.1 MAG: hypothetical protein CTY23_00485 [Methylomonas sp.]PPD24526.1 MAG: hypothetical protein CTY22_11075 [Methylomonas sp.]PPD33091.1 MAG: hypothetical protein CTY21_11000 [Methylomonas sp.]PPD41818.1 MAG: hypothetical protein CTY17_02760 [Methylomonas sp.]